MDAKRNEHIRQLFDAVMQMTAAERQSFLEIAGETDPDLSEEVQTVVLEHPTAMHPGLDLPDRREGPRLGAYQILRPLGEGGMGVVYLARRADGAFEKEVAIKIIREELAAPQFLLRFQRERDILAKLEHPHIARLLDGNISPPYVVMEYVKGEPLLEFANSRKLTFDARLALLRQIASAVDYAHARGVIHRDLKPSNIFVTHEGDVKLLDFGIAAWQQEEGERQLSPTLAMSPAYASPEQMRGDETNHLTDIYSLGLMAYELLAGVQPFCPKGRSFEEILHIVLHVNPPAPSVAVRESANPGLVELSRQRQISPIDLITRLETVGPILLRALAKHRALRPVSAGELMVGLTKEPRSRRSWMRWLRPNLDLIVCECIFLWLALSGHVTLNGAGWFGTALMAFVAISQRVDFPGKWYWQVALVYTFFAVQNAGARPMLAAVFLLFGFHFIRFLRRERRLGRLIVGSRTDAKDERFGVSAALPIGALVYGAMFVYAFAVENPFLPAAHPRVPTLGQRIVLIWVPVLMAAMLMRLPFEIREKGVSIRSVLYPWTAIREYRWITPSELLFSFKSSVFPYPFAQLRTNVHPDDCERVQAILEEWIREGPRLPTYAS